MNVEGRIVDVNRAAVEQTGFSRDEFLGRLNLGFLPPESTEAIKEAMRLPVVRPYQASILRKNGEVRIVQVQVRIIDYDGRSAQVAMIMDITEQVNARKQIEELAARSEAEKSRLRTILETYAGSGIDIRC